MPALRPDLSLAHFEVLPDHENHLDLAHLGMLLQQGLIQSLALALLDQRVSVGVLLRGAVLPVILFLWLSLVLVGSRWLEIRMKVFAEGPTRIRLRVLLTSS